MKSRMQWTNSRESRVPPKNLLLVSQRKYLNIEERILCQNRRCRIQ